MPDNPDRESCTRNSHAQADEHTRAMKAAKIVEIVSMFRDLEGTRLLEIGCGSGQITRHLSEAVTEAGTVYGVDVVDERVVSDGYRFQVVSGTTLPFEDSSFDIVVSNHVLEHVGDDGDQAKSLSEIVRVLATGGLCYLAVPNRWSLIEPHYQLAFLSWLSQPFADRYIRFRKKGVRYDVNPPSRSRLLAMIDGLEVTVHDMTGAAMRSMAALEAVSAVKRAVFTAPAWAIRTVVPIIPTMVYALEKE